MNNNNLKTILTVIVIILLFAVAMSILKWLVRVLLPLALVVIAAYIVYRFVSGRKI
jgi:hypothetical protein